ncbi:hypothetical protein C8F04DRAFT_230459 [Mycena alexandri]|uniref:Uncharacterized protein n=1 Tax=Mycena alexandri TaxID=1745969 RepID=A0AAD6S8E4_9AGAR|nr:hypothetical protein C8F04DRAFT_230459 [Mycena alexandri]
MGKYISPQLDSLIQLHFEDHLLQAKLRLNMPTATDSSSRSQATAPDAERAFDSLCEASLVSQLLFISQQRSAGALFTVIAVVRSLLSLVSERTLWLKPNVAYSENASYLRLRPLQSLSSSYYRADVIAASDIAGWITTNIIEPETRLSVASKDVWSQYSMERTPMNKILGEWATELPTLYWAREILHDLHCNPAAIFIQPQLLTANTFLGSLAGRESRHEHQDSV